jgi:hypothetical protein
MTINLLRMAVRIESVSQLKNIQLERMANTEGGHLYTITRNVPKRIDELSNGGSIYWVVKRLIRVRQKIICIEQETSDDGRKYCMISLDPSHILLEPRHQKPFQGWRYLKPEEAPPDLAKGASSDFDMNMPSEMVEELKELGLL